MEEFRDLRLTVDAFKKVLSEKEFIHLNAGIVLQAYLPDSHAAFAELLQFAKNRYEISGGSIKVRLVKGANLAMEKTEGELNGYTPAPYPSKAEVDASYSRLIDVALRSENYPAVRIGIASHNLFHLTWAIEVAKMRGCEEQIDIEMLEGMANAEALAIVKSGHPVLFYTPVTNQDDFASAVAYLVRRLDENTSPENYLRATFEISSNLQIFAEQKTRFENSVANRHSISTSSRRHSPDPVDYSTFHNQANGDPTLPRYIESIKKNLHEVANANYEVPIVINGQEIRTSNCEPGIDPGDNGKQWYKYCVADTGLIDQAIESAKRGFEIWSKTPVKERQDILFAAAKIMQDEREQTIATMSRDAGKTVYEADPEVSEAIDFARYYGSLANDDENSNPLGIVLVVPPWNFPYAIVMGGVCAALAAGNTVILKPAPETVATGWIVAKQLWAAGVPKEVLQFVPTRDDDSGKYLVTHDEVKALILTGSIDTAALFLGWKSELNILAETSGKNALLISACADIDSAVKDLVQSAFGHAGQKCSAASLGIVVESIYQDPSFIRQLKDDVSSLAVGAGWNLGTIVGPIIRKPEGALLRALTTLDEGESWLIKPEQVDHAGYLWRQGVKVGVKPGSWSHKNEWFGPVLALMVAPDFETAVQWQNESDFGLTAGLHSLDESECVYWLENIQAGNLYVNRGITGAVVQRQPFGGWKKSSVGPTSKAGGPNYLNNLRRWQELTGYSTTMMENAIKSFDDWWENKGSKAIDYSNLSVEKNFFRYRYPLTPILVRFDDTTSEKAITLIEHIAQKTNLKLIWSKANAESAADALNRGASKIRWLSSEEVPVATALAKGINIDPRPITLRGDIEGPRWFVEQSVAVTYHRYGNTNGGPKPKVSGLN